MANIIWNGSAGDWTDPDNWTPAQVPVSGDTATITGTGTADVSINGSDFVSISGLVMNDALGSLEINGSLTATQILLQSGTINNYGTLADTTVINSGGDFEFGYGLLKGDTWQGNLEVGGEGMAVVQGGLTTKSLDGTGPGTITIDGADSTLLFNDTETFDNATITMGSATGLANLDAGGTVTFGSGVTIQTTTTAFFDDSLGGEGTIVNDGTIIASAPSGELDLESPTFINNGAITATGGVKLDIQPYGTFANNGTLTVGNGSVASIQYLNAFTNTGTIAINGGGELDLDTYASALTQTQVTGGTVEIDGLFNAEGETLNLAADSAFSTILNYGTLENATLLENGGTLDIGYGLFKADTIQGTFDVNGESTAEIQGGLTALSLDGTGPGDITIDGADSTLLFNDTETFDNATITMGSATGLSNLDAGGTVTFGSGVTIQTSAADFFDDSLGGEGTIINDGTITADATSGEMDLESPTFINNGDISVAYGTSLDIQPYGTFANNGTLTVGVDSVASIQYLNAFTNTGLITVDAGGELDLDTYASALTKTQATGGTVEIDGLFNAEGETLNVATDSNFSTITNNGTIENATFVINGGTLGIGNGLFQADTVQGNFEIGGDSTAQIKGGLTSEALGGTGAGSVTIDGDDSTLQFDDTETFNNATITMGSATGVDTLDAEGTLTLGAGVTVQTASDINVVNLEGSGTIINDGTITANATDGEVNLETDSFVNNGAITVTGGTDLNVETGSAFTNAGTMTISDGSIASVQFMDSFTNTGTIAVDDATLIVDTATTAGATDGVTQLSGDALAVYDLDVDATQTVQFMDGTNNELDLATPSSFQGTISGFQEGNTIDLEGYAGDTYSFADNTLTFSDNGGVSATLYFAGSYTASDFTATDTTSGDLLVTTDVLPCFVAGTRIRTPRGDVRVETLREGDEVITVTDGVTQVMPVTWIGMRAVDILRHRDADKVRPIRIRQGAFADNLPARDLLLSPDHAIFAEGVLVPVKYLVNGTTIVIEGAARQVVYVHVELAQHEILLAEGLPTESYLETGGRNMFQNGGLPVVLHADFARLSWDALGCHELKVTGIEVDAIRATLGARADDVAGQAQRRAG
ncbi:Hint domain-containing protein [Acidisoma cladoniae]|jgi:hypothetical protein|uniref:Hint domain-containing protein n=1 Tax=Acidisoma cladoniae TaxID=3040935 RepID=UPI00254EB135|nr:Hint domain-containing protein [Acidisoma sp. PAMC 29798]